MCDMTYTKACGPQVRVPGGSALLPVGAEAREGSGGKTPRECLEREREAGSRAVGAEDARDAREKEKEKEKERSRVLGGSGEGRERGPGAGVESTCVPSWTKRAVRSASGCIASKTVMIWMRPDWRSQTSRWSWIGSKLAARQRSRPSTQTKTRTIDKEWLNSVMPSIRSQKTRTPDLSVGRCQEGQETMKAKERTMMEDREEDGPKGRKAVVHHPGWRILQTADGSITSMLTQISRSGILPQVCRVCVQIV